MPEVSSRFLRVVNCLHEPQEKSLNKICLEKQKELEHLHLLQDNEATQAINHYISVHC